MNKQETYEQIPFCEVTINDVFWSEILKVHQDVTIDTCIKRCEETGRIENFETASKGFNKGTYNGVFYNDSDVYKVLEGAAYSLMNIKNDEFENKIDSIIDKIGSAQEDDGYLMGYYTVEAPDEKWSNLEKHEMYCGGHLIEAAVAHYQSTGKKNFLNIACKLVDCYMNIFGENKRKWVPGHEEIELALVRLYEVTKEEKYLKFAYWLLEQRGKGYGGNEGDVKFDPHCAKLANDNYFQNNVPVKDIEKVVGHAVRAIYLYTGMADVNKYIEAEYSDALHRVWDNIINKNMYVTGGIGPSKENEGFTTDYDLPNKAAYCETCAAIALAIWNLRMAQLEGDAKYVDIVERAMYNNILAGRSLSGDKFFYVNPLEADGSHNREAWYGTACCPTNICRFIPSIGQYIYGTNDDEIYVNLFIGSNLGTKYKGKDIEIKQETNYPIDNKIILKPVFNKEELITINLRVPSWCNSVTLKINNKLINSNTIKGYIEVQCYSGDVIEYTLDMPIKLVHTNDNVKENIGKLALTRGPIIYVLEQQDQNMPLKDIQIPSNAFTSVNTNLMGGLPTIDCNSRDGEKIATFIPYFTWNNRGADAMSVWIKERKIDTLYY